MPPHYFRIAQNPSIDSRLQLPSLQNGVRDRVLRRPGGLPLLQVTAPRQNAPGDGKPYDALQLPLPAELTRPRCTSRRMHLTHNATLRAARPSPRFVCAANAKEASATGVVFEPFNAVKGELAVVDKSPLSESYARVDFHPECEAAINEQIK